MLQLQAASKYQLFKNNKDFFLSHTTCPVWVCRVGDEGLWSLFIVSQCLWVRNSGVTQLGNSGPASLMSLQSGYEWAM